MNTNKILIALFFVASVVQFAIAKEKAMPGGEAPQDNEETVSLRESCFASASQTDLDINNVRARLLGGGDLWWDLTDGRYVIPNVGPGEREVSSIFAAAIWIGGYDSGNNLRIAAQTYRQNGNDFWPGPIIDEENVTTDQVYCQQWDEHFEVKGETIDDLIADFLGDDDGDGAPDGSVDGDIDLSLRRWPARNNPYFEESVGFALPQDRDLAPFYDENVDGIYDPRDGDIPIIGLTECGTNIITDAPYADQMIWWVYNDVGDVHSESGAPQIGMEIQALAFAFATSNAINNMSFYRYKLLNKASTTLFDTYIGQWVDPDLGCYSNDYVGCVVDESLGIVYNGTEADNDCDGVNGYRDRVPMLGVDYFRGPKDENGEELGMSAFIYYNNNIDPGNNPATTNPDEAQDYYGYLSGFWKDDTPVQFGGDGYGEGTSPTPYMFPDDPSGGGWSECSVGNDPDDRRFVQSSGPFRLEPGATNEVIVGAVWVDDIDYPCPSYSRLLRADRVAQALFDNCFDIIDGPDAPDISIRELDRELILTLSNSPGSNNVNENYSEKDPLIPPGFPDSLYNFQGYAIYQLQTPTISCEDINECDEAKLIAVVDVKDGVGRIVNYESFDESLGTFTPKIQVEGDDLGIRHSFRILDDKFATSDSRLVNNKKYYFQAIAYAYNNYAPFDPTDFENTQPTPYLQGRRNVRSYTGIPHINDPEESGRVVNSEYGNAPQITRIDGEGMGGEFLELTQESIEEICQNGSAQEITYEANGGPFEVKIYDPLNLKAGTYTVRLVDTFNGELTDSIYWTLEGEGISFSSDKFIYSANEQLIPELGISISIQQTNEVYNDPLLSMNGFVGASIEYADPAGPAWYGAIGDDAFGAPITNYIKTATGEPDADQDPNRVYSNILEGAWCPLHLTTFEAFSPDPNIPDAFLSPRPDFNSFIFERGKENLPNVDIVLTSDKSKWSRCPVVNTFSPFYTSQSSIPNPEPDYFRIRQSPSKGKDGQEDGTGTGMSWFPGYAINVETGERLNIFFGENIFFGGLLTEPDITGYDMLWNPSNEFAVTDFPSSLPEFSFGAQHYIYVSNTKYDEGNALLDGLAADAGTTSRANTWGSVGWTSFPFPNMELNSIEDGLIPNDVTFKLRVDNPFRITENGGSEGGRPTYKFTIDPELVADTDNRDVAENALDLIRAVPNPYYGYSAYESSSFDQKIKITNLPAKCKVSIYSLDGRLIRTYNRNAQADPSRGSDQLITSEEWDLKNEQGVNVASGVYIIHIDASESGLGEKVIKWFGGVRDFDATGL